MAEPAKLNARLLAPLRDRVYDDAKGILNIAREKEIKKLANKLRSNLAMHACLIVNRSGGKRQT
ncbi:MAG: hypothetical protein WBC78_12115 [Candidatus Sulfotelmatobacter sp.]